MSAKPYHHGNLRSALIDAGLAALERADSKEISLRALARDVGVSANAAYRHFEDKDALLSALAAEGFRRFAAQQTEALTAKPDLTASRKASGLAYIDFARKNPALFRLMFGQFLQAKTDPELGLAAAAAFQGLLEASAQETGASSDPDLVLRTAILRWSVVHGMSHLLLDGQLDVFAGHNIDKLIEDVLALAPRLTATEPEPAGGRS